MMSKKSGVEMLNYEIGILLMTIITSSAILIFVRIPKDVEFTFNPFELNKRLNAVITPEERLESHNMVRSIFINIFAGFLTVTLMLSINTYFYNCDLKDIEKKESIDMILHKYEVFNKDDAINIINSKIDNNKKDWERLNESNTAIKILAFILFSGFILVSYKDRKVKNIFQNMIIELSICIIAFGVFTAVIFLDVNSYIFAVSASCISFLLMAIAFMCRR